MMKEVPVTTPPKGKKRKTTQTTYSFINFAGSLAMLSHQRGKKREDKGKEEPVQCVHLLATFFS
jgi:hypothetical protein